MMIPLINGLSGCVPLEAIAIPVNAVSGYFSYKAATREVVEVTTIAPECHLIRTTNLTCEEKKTLPKSVRREFAKKNRALAENCPNIEFVPTDCGDN